MKPYLKTVLTELREIVFGLEDGMVSTLGTITGLAAATGSAPIVIVSGFVIIAVESLSMAAGTYLSNKSEKRADSINHIANNHQNPLVDALYMGISYVIGGVVPLYPYWILPINFAIPLSITSVVLWLFIIGFFSGKLTRVPAVRAGVEMVIVSLSAAGLGYLVGYVASSFFPQIKSQV